MSYTTTGATDRSSIVRGDVAFVSGVLIAGGIATATIVTGGSTVLSCGVHSSATAAITCYRKNFDGLAATANGSIGVTQMAENLTGDWWAIVTGPQ